MRNERPFLVLVRVVVTTGESTKCIVKIPIPLTRDPYPIPVMSHNPLQILYPGLTHTFAKKNSPDILS